MKTTEKQFDETGPNVWSAPEATGYCSICHQRITVGQEYYAIGVSTGFHLNRRHSSCARKPKKPVQQGGPQASITGKRRRTGGHGFSGGDGFTDHFQ